MVPISHQHRKLSSHIWRKILNFKSFSPQHLPSTYIESWYLRKISFLDIWYLEKLLRYFLLYFFFFLFFFFFCLCWVFVSAQGPSPVAASGGHSSSRCAGLSLSRPLLLRSTGSRRAGSVAVAHGPSCSAACGILPDQGSNPCPLHWQADSQPLRHQGSPYTFFNSLTDGTFGNWQTNNCNPTFWIFLFISSFAIKHVMFL